MDFGFTEEQRLLRDSVRKLLQKHAPPEYVRQHDRERTYPEDALVVWASRRVGGRPVKWVSTRSEALLSDSQGRDQVVTGELALDEHGKVLGLRVNALHAMGSHVFAAAMVVPLYACLLYTSRCV